MTVTTRTNVKAGRLDAISTAWGASPKLQIYSGTMPTDCNTSLSGNTMLAECTPIPASAAVGPPTTKDMLGGTKTVTAAAAGTASFYRVYNTGVTICYEQGTVGTSGQDLIIDNTNIALSQTVNFNTFVKTEP